MAGSENDATRDKASSAMPMAMTLHEWITDYDSEWPKGTCGMRLPRGRVIWTLAHYPDGCSGNWVCVSRIVHENGKTFTRVAYYDRDTKIEFVRE